VSDSKGCPELVSLAVKRWRRAHVGAATIARGVQRQLS
jgi:hypothetical protein